MHSPADSQLSLEIKAQVNTNQIFSGHTGKNSAITL
jgi:hypothetical protein